MAKLICLQSGHEGTTTGATGAPGEQELNVRIRNRLSQLLIAKGFQVQLVDANPPQAQINKDFDLFLALHGDANIYGTGGGFVDHPRPDTDAATIESQRIDVAIENEYFSRSGIVNHPERSNANTQLYYMWSRLSPKTPCVIMEMGVVQDPHDKVILADTQRVAEAIARGICKAFNVPYDIVAPEIPMTCIPTTEYDGLRKRLADVERANTSLTEQIALKDQECLQKLQAQRAEMVKKISDLASNL